ncbi:MAG: flagellar biosynthetic protein FliQ [Chlamydiales bacterium]
MQEQTLAFAVKMVAVLGPVLIMGGWLGTLIYQFAIGIFRNFYKWQ